MNTADTNTKLIDNYVGLLENLSTNNKLDLIAKLTEFIKTTSKKEDLKFYQTFGAWDERESADDLIKKIRDSRNLNRNRKEF